MYECQDCNHKYYLQGSSAPSVSESSSCPNCGSFRTQIVPTHSEMALRNMPSNGMDDMGGNPLQEGIWAGIDGGWQNRMKRDESFASVRQATVVLPAGGQNPGFHGDPRNALQEIEFGTQDGSVPGKPGMMINGMPLAQALEQIPYGHTEQLDITHPHPKVEQIASQVVQDGHSGVWNAMLQKARQRAMERQQMQPQASVKIADFWDDDDFDVPNPMEYGPQGDPFIVDRQGQLYRGDPGHEISPWHEDVAAQHNLPDFPHGYALGYSHPDTQSLRFVQNESGLDPSHMTQILQTHYPGHALPEEMGAVSNENRFGLPGPEYSTAERQDPNFMNRWQQEQQAVQQRGQPFRYHENPYFNRGGSMRDDSNSLFLPWTHDASKIAQDFEVVQVVPDGPHTVETEDGVVMQHEDPAALEEARQKIEAARKTAFLPLLALLGAGAAEGGMAAAGGTVARGVAGGLISGALRSAVSPQAQEPSAVGGGVPDQYMSSFHEEILAAHPSVDDNYSERADGDPEDVDPHEFNDGDNSVQNNDVSPVGSEGLRPEVTQAIEEAMPSLLQYYHSDESGEHDPAIQKLLQTLQQYDPELLDEPVSPEAQQALDSQMPKISAGVPGIGMPAQIMPSGNQPAMVNPTTQASCPHCGAMVTPGQGICAQCGGALQSPQAPPAPGQQVPGTAPGPGQQYGVLSANQGPHSIEQIQAVVQFLQQQGQLGPDTVMDVINNPANYADILAQITQRQEPPTPDPDPGPPPPQPDPSMMGGQGMPQGMPMQAKEAADNIAPQCPKCGTHTTETLISDIDPGNFRCHRCGDVWKRDDVLPTKFGAPLSDHPVLEGAPAADQTSPDDLSQDVNPGIWQTTDGQALKVGSQYEMYSDKYDVPDLVKITSIKPDGIEYVLQGEYGLEHRTAVSKQEADMDGIQFLPVGADDPQPDPQDGSTDSYPGTADPAQVTDLSGGHDYQLQAKTAELQPDWDKSVSQPGEGRGPLMDCPHCGKTMRPSLGTCPHCGTILSQMALSHIAGKKYTPMEQREFIDEPGVARNSDKLDLENTHYVEQPSLSDDFFLLGW